MKRIFFYLFITIAILFNFVACGNDENSINNVVNNIYIEQDNTNISKEPIQELDQDQSLMYDVRGNWVFDEVYTSLVYRQH